ncbi:RICIN domain-containing protein [Chloroflexota bacterium]
MVLLKCDMKNRQCLVVLSTLLTFILLITSFANYACSSNPSVPPSIIRGFVVLDEPIASATISIYDPEGNEIFTEKEATSENGAFDIAVQSLPENFKITATKGTLEGEPFTEEVINEVQGYDTEVLSLYILNPISTLIALYWNQHPGIEYSHVEVLVREFLEVHPDIHVVNSIDLNTSYFSPLAFMAEADRAGGFHAYIAELVNKLDSGETQAFRPLQAGPVETVASSFLNSALKDIASGVFQWVGGKGSEFLFDLIIGSDEYTQEDMKNKLELMDQKLDKIASDIEFIKGAMDRLGAKLDLLAWNNAVRPMMEKAQVIETTYKKITDMTEAAKRDAASDETNMSDIDKENAKKAREARKKTVENYSESDGDILSTSSGVFYAMDIVHNHIMGWGGATPILEEVYKQTRNKLSDGNKVNCYNYFADYFANLLGIQIKGVHLIVNAYAGADLQGEAEKYVSDFYEKKLVPQVNLFLSLVETLVWENDDAKWSEVILGQEFYIFEEADKLVDSLLGSYSIENGELKIGEDKGAITVRVRYPASAPFDTIRFKINGTENSDPIKGEKVTGYHGTSYNVHRYKFIPPKEGVYSLDTTGHEAILHDYGEEEIQITSGEKYGYLGVYAWAPSSDNYYQITSVNSGKCIDSSGYADGDNIHQWTYFGFQNQQWVFEHVGGGYYRIVNRYSEKVLDVLSYSKEDKANVIQWHWHDTDNEKWRLHLLQGGKYKIINKNSGKVLDVLSYSKINGGNIIQYHWQNTNNQKWQIEVATHPSITVKIVPKFGNDNVLDARWAGGQGATVQVTKSNNTNAQKWQLKYLGNASVWYRLTPKHNTSMCVDVAYESKDSDADIHLWTYLKHDNQKWTFRPVGNGYYKIVNKNSGKCMTTIKGAVFQQTYRGLDEKHEAQKWKVVITK